MVSWLSSAGGASSILIRLRDHAIILAMDCMLTWPSGPRDTDGVWAPHWYGQVQQSTGFHHPRPPGKRPELTGEAAETAEICREYYDQLHAARFVIPDASR